jgi:hypothetical protein
MNTVRKDLRRLTKEGLQISHTGEESSRREDEKDQAQPGPDVADELSSRIDKQVGGKLPRKVREENKEVQIDSGERHPGGPIVTSQV